DAPKDAGDDLDNPEGDSRAADAEMAAKHNVAVDDKGTAGGIFEKGDATPEGAADHEGTKPVAVATEPEDEPAQSDPEPVEQDPTPAESEPDVPEAAAEPEPEPEAAVETP